jgi:hypothetical protein
MTSTVAVSQDGTSEASMQGPMMARLEMTPCVAIG